jgi:hypothetical protein
LLADERLHASFHASAAQGPRYQGWQGERVAVVDGSKGRLLLFNSADQKRGRKVRGVAGWPALYQFCSPFCFAVFKVYTGSGVMRFATFLLC